MPLPCNRAWRGLGSLGGGTQRSPLAQLRVYTPQGSPWANTDVLPATLWSLGGRPAPSGSLQEGQTLKGPKRFAPVHDPHQSGFSIFKKITASTLDPDVIKLSQLGTVFGCICVNYWGLNTTVACEVFDCADTACIKEKEIESRELLLTEHALQTCVVLLPNPHLYVLDHADRTAVLLWEAKRCFQKHKMDDINVLHHRCLLNLRRRIRDIGDGRPAQERYMRLQKDGDTLSYQGNSEEVGCYVAGHPLSKGNCYFEVTIVDTGVRGTIAVGLVPKFYRLDHQPGWLPYSVAYHADNGKKFIVERE
ncbi:SPRY domain-containing protein 3 [Larimichthys crocea]|uniref:Uncharacterized protein n=1 Tax=Larimichthys crocea TaxID=215358 RepID=A0ACD3R972_LARCR|nr:SPRY domain-containing protein 3 [Larimichthys crocea]